MTAIHAGPAGERLLNSCLKSRQRSRQSGLAAERPSLRYAMPAHALAGIDPGTTIGPFIQLAKGDADGNRDGNGVRTSLQTDTSARPSEPKRGSLTSIIDAPPATAARASSAERTLTSNVANPAYPLEA